ncbi:hypothetical protein CF326_g9886, partial [Tilletia indica]
MNEGDYKVLTPPEEVEKWEARLRHPECPPEDGHPYYRFEVTDGHRYKRTIFKKGTDMLWPQLRDYSDTYKHWSPEVLVLSVRGCPLDPYKEVDKTFLQNGDQIFIAQSTAFMFYGEPKDRLSYLSPVDINGESYETVDGPLTREDESMLRLNFERFWPLLPSIHIKCRARDDSTVEELALIIATLTRVPVRSLRITHDGLRAYGELGQYREKDKIDLDVHPEQVGGGILLKYPYSALTAESKDSLDGMTRVLIRHPQYSVQVHMASTFPLRHVLDFLHEQFGQKIALLHEQKIVDPNNPLHQLTKGDGQGGEETFIKLEARTIQRTFEVLKDVVIPDLVHIMVLPVHVDGTATTRPCVMPFGTTLLQWWHIYQGTDMMRDPTFYLDGAP